MNLFSILIFQIIKNMRTYILRCYGCFKTTSIMIKMFCPNCGHKTLKRVAVSLDENGQQIVIYYKSNVNTSQSSTQTLHSSTDPHQSSSSAHRQRKKPIDSDTARRKTLVQSHSVRRPTDSQADAVTRCSHEDRRPAGGLHCRIFAFCAARRRLKVGVIARQKRNHIAEAVGTQSRVQQHEAATEEVIGKSYMRQEFGNFIVYIFL